MIEFKDHKIQIVKMDPKIGNRKGEEKEAERVLTLSLTGVIKNTDLANFHPSLLAFVYKHDDAPDMVGHEKPTKLVFADLFSKLNFDKLTVEGANVSIDYGIGSSVDFELCKIHSIGIEPQEGGTVLIWFKITGKQTGKAVGTVFESHLGGEVTITITKPEAPQGELLEGES